MKYIAICIILCLFSCNLAILDHEHKNNNIKTNYEVLKDKIKVIKIKDN